MESCRSERSGRPRRSRRLGLALLATAGVIGILAAGCGEPEPDSATGPANVVGSNAEVADVVKPAEGPPKMGGTLIVGLDAESPGWDPTASTLAGAGLTVARSVFDPLATIDKDMKPQPFLAESFTPSDNYQTWNIKLRSGIKFHNGEALDAAAVHKFMTKYKAGTLGAAFGQVASIEIADPLTVRLKMTMPWTTFPIILTVQPGLVPAPAQLDSPESKLKAIGTGPFRWVDWQANKQLIVEKNPDYWRKGLPYLDKIDFRPIGDDQTRYASFSSGGLDVMISPREQSIQNLAKDGQAGKVQVVRAKGDNDVNMLIMNTSKPPFNDPRLRKAIAYAVDRSQILALNNSGPELAADSLYAKSSKWYVDPGFPQYDPEKAKSLVKEIEAQTGPVTITLETVPDQDLAKQVQVLQQLLREVGIELKVAQTEQGSLVTDVVLGKYQIATWRQFGATDPDGNYTWFASENADGALALNMARNKDPQIDKALRDGRGTTDEAKRKESYGILQKRLAEDLPYVFTTHLRWTMGAQNNIRGIEGGTLPNGSPSAGLISPLMPLNEMWKAS